MCTPWGPCVLAGLFPAIPLSTRKRGDEEAQKHLSASTHESLVSGEHKKGFCGCHLNSFTDISLGSQHEYDRNAWAWPDWGTSLIQRRHDGTVVTDCRGDMCSCRGPVRDATTNIINPAVEVEQVISHLLQSKTILMGRKQGIAVCPPPAYLVVASLCACALRLTHHAPEGAENEAFKAQLSLSCFWRHLMKYFHTRAALLGALA